MKYLSLFESIDSALNYSGEIGIPHVAVCADGEDKIVFSGFPEGEVEFKFENGELKLVEKEELPSYVTFTAEEDNSSIGLAKLSTNQTMEYSMDTTIWNTFDTTTNIPLNNGDKVYVRGVLNADNTGSNYTQFKMSGKIAVSGNCNALWNYEDLNAPLKSYCGGSMFKNCTSLTSVPVLPATTLANYCYWQMFYGCTSLTTVPVLPATILAKNCYGWMFRKCTSLTTAPALPATVLAESCYYLMFYGCTSLTTASELPATVLAKSCYNGMFYGCTSLITAPDLPATELAAECYRGMFEGCTSLVASPKLPAPILTSYCYYGMFEDCTSLNKITCLAISIPTNSNCTSYWVAGVAQNGTFIKHPDMTWTSGVNSIPVGWTVEDYVE